MERRVISLLVENHFGVLTRVTNLFGQRGFNIDTLSVGETENPKKLIPQAINNIPIRIIIFYVGALAIIMSIYPFTAVNDDSSPFV